MSLNNMTRILVRAIESRGCRDAAERRAVYSLSRQTLERFFHENTELSEEEKTRQRSELEAAIDHIETTLAGERREPDRAPPAPPPPPAAPPLPPRPPRPANPPPVASAPLAPPPPIAAPEPPRVAASRPPVATPPPPPAARPAPAAPPPSPRAPQVPPPVNRTAPAGEPPLAPPRPPSPPVTVPPPPRPDTAIPPRPATAPPPAPQPDETATDDADDELFADAPDVVETTDVEPPEPAASWTRRLRAAALIVVPVLLFGFYQVGDLGNRIHRFIVDVQIEPEKDTVKRIIAATIPTDVENWARVIRPRLDVAGPAGTTGIFHWDETKGPVETGASGRIAWKSSPTDPAAATGRLTFDDGSPAGEIAVEVSERVSATDLVGLVLVVRFAGDVEKRLYAPALTRIDPVSGRPDELNAAGMRVGIDRAMVGYDAPRAEMIADLEGDRVYRLAFTSETDLRNVYYFRLPNGLAAALRSRPASK